MTGRVKAIPDKLYFRIGEVSSIVGVKAYVLRYWESEFPDIRPSKSKSGQRLYKRRDVELLLQVRELLYDRRFTIDGARQRLRELIREGKTDESIDRVADEEIMAVPPAGVPSTGVDKTVLKQLRHGLEECLAQLESS